MIDVGADHDGANGLRRLGVGRSEIAEDSNHRALQIHAYFEPAEITADVKNAVVHRACHFEDSDIPVQVARETIRDLGLHLLARESKGLRLELEH